MMAAGVLPLKWVGLKVDPNSVIVFQELEQRLLPEQVSIRQAVLTDFLLDQVNTLNITKNGMTHRRIPLHAVSASSNCH